MKTKRCDKIQFCLQFVHSAKASISRKPLGLAEEVGENITLNHRSFLPAFSPCAPALKCPPQRYKQSAMSEKQKASVQVAIWFTRKDRRPLQSSSCCMRTCEQWPLRHQRANDWLVLTARWTSS